MTDDELLDKVCSLTDRWSKPLLTGIGGYLLSAIVIAWNVTDWVVANARDNLGALIAFGVGGALTGAVLASLFWRHVVKRALKAKDDAATKTLSSGLEGMDGFEHIDDLGSLVEKARGLSSLNDQLATQIADRDARIAELEKRPTQEDVDSLKDDRISLQKQLATANDYWKSQIARTQADVSAKNAELEREKSIHAGEIAARDAEIASLKSDKQPKYKIPSTDLVLQMSPVVASRVYKAYKRGAYIPLNEIEPCAINSIGGGDGLFEYRTLVNPFGQRLEAKEYGLSRKWRAFLDEPAHLAQLKTVAAGWLSPEE